MRAYRFVEAAWGFENTLHKTKSLSPGCDVHSELYIKLAESYQKVAQHFSSLMSSKIMSNIGFGRVSILGYERYAFSVAVLWNMFDVVCSLSKTSKVHVQKSTAQRSFTVHHRVGGRGGPHWFRLA